MLKEIDGKEERRSYSICSGLSEQLAIGVKRVEQGVVSNWFVKNAKEEISFTYQNPKVILRYLMGQKIAALAAGSGITPILSILNSKI